MNPWIAGGAAAIGYLLGGISFTRMVARLAVPDEDIEVTQVELPGSGVEFVFDRVSASSFAMRGRPLQGCLTSALDMAKAAIPTAIFWQAFPDQDYFLIVAAASVAGHNFPIYYRFKGGGGMSPLFGGLLVIDWLAIPVTVGLSSLIGFGIVRDVLIAYTGTVVLLVPWLWYRFGDPAYVAYAIAVNVFFWIAIFPFLGDYISVKRAGTFANQSALETMQSFHLGFLMKFAQKRGWIAGPQPKPTPSGASDMSASADQHEI